MSLEIGTGKAGEANEILTALARGREDHQFFSQTFLKRTLHPGQLKYVENAHATMNLLATANRWGKTTVLSHVHNHGNIYKTGGEPRYLDPVTGEIDHEKFLQLRYQTFHGADLLDTALLVWHENEKIIGESPMLRAFIREHPRSQPPHVVFIHGSRWQFRSLGDDASGIDGNSYYKISIDEAGWIGKLEEKTDNVIRVRVADVSGEIHFVGTFKPGIAKDFYKYCVRASSHTGIGLSFEHRTDEDAGLDGDSNLDAAIAAYLREYFTRWTGEGNAIDEDLAVDLSKLGISADEFADAATRGGH